MGDAPISRMQANGELFRGMHSVVQSLTQQRDCAHALAWCQKHKSALQKKPESAAAGFEFALRVQSPRPAPSSPPPPPRGF